MATSPVFADEQLLRPQSLEVLFYLLNAYREGDRSTGLRLNGMALRHRSHSCDDEVSGFLASYFV
jgi:hypothetical protein